MSGVIEKIEIKEGDLVKESSFNEVESDTNSNLSITLENSLNLKKQQIDSLNSQMKLTQEIYSENKELLKEKINIYEILLIDLKNY